jgi:hypothetical protein
MTKVEDLKRVIVAIVADANFDEEMDAHRNQITLEQCKIDAEADVDLLISASHAEGVAEERERILASGRRIDRDECTDGFAECDEFVCPYSLLAPKESEK